MNDVVTTCGIKETKEIVKFGIDMGEAFDKAFSDGKFGVEDLSHFFTAFLSASDAFEGIGLVPNEIKDMSPEELLELKAYIVEEFDIANDKLEEVIEKSLSIALAIYEMIMLFKGGLFSKEEATV